MQMFQLDDYEIRATPNPKPETRNLKLVLSDHGSLWNDRVFRNDDNTFADHPVIGFDVLVPVPVQNLDAVADPGVFVDDGLFDDAVSADRGVGSAKVFV